MEGLIMYLPNKISISQIKENFKNLNIYLNHLKEGKCDECKKVIDDNYFKTAGIYKFIFIQFLIKAFFLINIEAGLILACYLLGLGDRHNKNIMISKKGEIGHIDFGYIMNKDPISRKVLGNFTIKLNRNLIGPLLEDKKKIKKPFDDKGFKKLIDACKDGFIALRSKSSFYLIYKQFSKIAFTLI